MEDITQFFGRFHPLIVHLPIGFLILAGIMQVLSIKIKKYATVLDPAIGVALLWGAIACIGAVAIGWLLSLQGGYDEKILFWHKWLGILLTIISFLAWLIKSQKIRLPNTLFYGVVISILILVSVSGHLGGSLTHGEDYLLAYSPNFIKKIAGVSVSNNETNLKNKHPDSVKVYADVIQPILNEKCASCHNASKMKGGLVLTNYDDFIKGGDNGNIINNKNPLESEFLFRVTLAKGHKKYMPPRGKPLTFSEIQIISWWMQSGSDSISKFSTSKFMNNELIHTLNRDYQLDYSAKPYYEKVKVDSLSLLTLSELQQNNFKVNFMGKNSHMISVGYKGASITKEQIEKLLLAKEQITWLNLSNCGVTDDLLQVLLDLTNLTSLNLHSNPITDIGIKDFMNLEHLTSLNLYDTKIGSTGLEEILQLPSLSKIYVWKTAITTDFIEEISSKYPKIEIISELN